MRGSIRKRGKRWYYYFYATMNGERKKIERVGGDTRQEAIKALNKALHEIDKGEVINSSIKYSDLIEIWLKEHVSLNCRKSTAENYKSLLNSQILPHLQSYKLSELKPLHGQRVINNCSKTLTKSTVQQILVILKMTLDYAVYPLELINKNPFRLIKLPAMQKKSKDIKTVSIDDFNTIVSKFKATDHFYILLNIIFYTGCRFGEAHALKWSDINFDDKTININKTTATGLETGEVNEAKTAESDRIVYISDELIALLRTYKNHQNKLKLKYGKHYNDNDLVVSKKNGDALTRASCFARIRRYNKKHNTRFSFHMLRHTHATLLLANGVPISEISKRLGHSNSQVTLSIYSHETDKGQKEIATIFDEIISR